MSRESLQSEYIRLRMELAQRPRADDVAGLESRCRRLLWVLARRYHWPSGRLSTGRVVTTERRTDREPVARANGKLATHSVEHAEG